MRKKTFAAVVVAACTLGISGNAFALYGPGPESLTGCTAPLITDWDDDAVVDQSGIGLGTARLMHPAPDDMNITSTNLKWTTVGGTPHLVADIGVVNLSGTPMSPADSQGGNQYYAFFTTPDGVVRFVRAMIRTQDGVTYGYGQIAHLEAQGQGLFDVYQTDGTTTGKLVTGPKGHVIIDVPASLVKLGDNLTEVFGNADGIFGYDDFAGFNNHIDEAPDGVDTFNPGGAAFKVTAC